LNRLRRIPHWLVAGNHRFAWPFLGLPVERDFSFKAPRPISAYIAASQAKGRIAEQIPVTA
jgi:hypothetical protein